MPFDTPPVSDVLQKHLSPLEDTAASLDPLMEQIGDAHYVLLGEATHGTHEFYRIRAAITQRLIEEKGFTAVAVEADWPDAHELNAFVQAADPDAPLSSAFTRFERFPTWMWRNDVVADFIGWLRDHNATQAPGERVGFYGLDLYGLYGSMEAVVQFLEKVDPDAARRARDRYGCFEDFAENPEHYGYKATLGASEPCEDEVVQQLIELQQRSAEYLKADGRVNEDAYFFAEQSARLVKNAERYYRAMFHGRHDTWNLRDSHMTETLDALMAHQARRFDEPKVVVWAHNSHLGDARYTEMSARGELNIGQLVRESRGDDCRLIGFTTHDGFVTAANDWGEAGELKEVRPSMHGSYERILHEAGSDNFILDLTRPEVADALGEPRLERAIGVVYRPQTERASHYFRSVLPRQFDAVLHIDRTHALVPMEPTPGWHRKRRELPETYPFGL